LMYYCVAGFMDSHVSDSDCLFVPVLSHLQLADARVL
jgi:hypothetical protein